MDAGLTTEQTPLNPRKTHTKSRAGCQTCKKRHVKCDETKPECIQCQNFRIPCDFLPPEEWAARVSEASPDNTSGQPRAQGRPRANWRKWAAEVVRDRAAARERERSKVTPRPVLQAAHSSPTSSTSSSVAATPALNTDELILFHHYLTVTASTLGHEHIYRDGIPKMGRQCPGILHAALSVASFHLARTDPLCAPRHKLSGEKHFEVAINSAASLIHNITIDNCQAIFALSSLLCFTALAKGPTPGDMVLITNDGRVAWLSLLAGARFVMRQFDSSVILSGVLDPSAPGAKEPCYCAVKALAKRGGRFELSYPGWDWRDSLGRLRAHISTSLHEDEAETFRRPVETLERCFQSLVTEPDSDVDPGVDFSLIMGWVYTLDQSFIETLESRHRTAIVLLGFFGTLLNALKGFWWLDGWGTQVLQESRRILGAPTYDEWLPTVMS